MTLVKQPPQQSPPTTTTTTSSSSSSSSSTAPALGAERPLTRDRLHAITTEFLSKEALQDKPLERKKEWLKAEKGLSEDEIEELLRLVKERKVKGKGKENGGETIKDIVDGEEKSLVPTELKEIKPTSLLNTPQPQQQHSPIPPPEQLQQPLIVTYPEFLAAPPQPPAPVNAKDLVAGMYYAGGVATTIYGASKYIFQPMYDQLTAARAGLAETALTNLTQFNSKLSALVPHRPAHLSSYLNSNTGGVGATISNGPHDDDARSNADSDLASDDEDDDNASSTSSLCTHVFHQDASTQTMPDPEFSQPDLPPSPESKLATISTHLATLVDSNSDGADGELQYELEALAAYLETLRVDVSQLYPWSGVLGASSNGGKEDLTQVVKREIRSVKGVLLNSKNFPGAR